MSGALVDLAAVGAQDQVDDAADLFKPEWTRGPNFVRAPRVLPLLGNPDFGSRQAAAEVPRDGDLLHKCYLRVRLPRLEATPVSGGVRWAKHPGHSLIRQVGLEIGEHKIVTHTGEFLAIYTDLRDDGTPKMRMIGEGLELTDFKQAHDALTLYVPLKFFHCEDLANALPVVALQHHRVRLVFEFREFAEMYETEAPGQRLPPARLEGAELVLDWVHLARRHRAAVAAGPHDMLISQVQYLEVNVAGEVSVPLRFFHAVREIVWVLQLNENAAANRHLHFNSATSDDAPRRHLLQEARLLVNGHERVPWMDAAYFYLVTNYEHHNDYSNLFAYLFSFATCPLKHQPTGSLNFSLLSDVTLQIRPDPRYVGPASPAKLKVWAVSQNELRVRSGMAGLRYAS